LLTTCAPMYPAPPVTMTLIATSLGARTRPDQGRPATSRTTPPTAHARGLAGGPPTAPHRGLQRPAEPRARRRRVPERGAQVVALEARLLAERDLELGHRLAQAQ